MGSSGCRETVEWFTATQAEDEGFRAHLRSLLRADEPDLDGVAELIRVKQPAIGALVTAEVNDLPRQAILAMLRAWSDAIDLGLMFRLVSEPPAAALQFARNHRVQLVIEFEEQPLRCG